MAAFLQCNHQTHNCIEMPGSFEINGTNENQSATLPPPISSADEMNWRHLRHNQKISFLSIAERKQRQALPHQDTKSEIHSSMKRYRYFQRALSCIRAA